MLSLIIKKKLSIVLKIFGFFTFLFCCSAFALSYDLPTNGNIVGNVQNASVRPGEDFSDIAERYQIGYYELFEANPGVDPDNPPADTILIIPTQFILPRELHNNIVINLAELRLYYQPQNSHKVYIYPIGIGEENWLTPTGTFSIMEKIVNPRWVPPASIAKFRKSIGDPVEKVVPAGPENPLGHYAMRLSSPTYLIHGTNAPEGVGRRSSAGCIRLYPNNIEQLFHLVPLKTEVVIINRPYKVGKLDGKLYLEAHLPLLEQRMKMGEDMSAVINQVAAADPTNSSHVDWNKANQVAREHLAVPRVISGEQDNAVAP